MSTIQTGEYKRYREYYTRFPDMESIKRFIENPDFDKRNMPKDSTLIKLDIEFRTNVIMVVESQEFDVVDHYPYPYMMLPKVQK